MNKKDFNKPRKRSELPFELQAIGRHIVYSEGTKTEPYYINNIKKLIANRYQVKPNDITIIQGNDKSTNTIYLVNNAIKDVDKRLKNKELIDHVWIFFDKDDFPKSHYDNANKKINNLNNSKKKNSQGYFYDIKRDLVWHSCYSNEAFELWLCLYFELIESAISRMDLINKLNANKNLKDIGFKYEKNLENIHDILTKNGGSIDKAIRNAKKLTRNETKNPSTGVYQFAEFFKKYIQKGK